MKGDRKMYCSKCGAEIGDAKYCPICGTKQDGYAASFTDRRVPQGDSMVYPEMEQQESYGRVAGFFKDMFSDSMFLVIAILISVSSAIGSFSFDSGRVRLSVGVISILIAVSLWITYASAKGSGTLSPSGPSFTSGVLKAYYILYWVGIVFMIVGGILCIVAGPLVSRMLPNIISSLTPEEIEELREIFELLPGFINDLDINRYLSYALVGIGIALLLGAVVMIIINLCFFRKIHQFAKSVCVSLKTDQFNIVKAKACKNWLIVAAVFSLLGGGLAIIPFGRITSSFSIHFAAGAGTLGGISALCSAGACILASIMINRYFVEGGLDR